MAFLFTAHWLLLLSVVFSQTIDDYCNYLYQIDTERAYPTDLCMQQGANLYIKYQCTPSLSYASNYTVIMQAFTSSECATHTLTQELDINEWITYQNDAYNTNIQIAYKCGGLDQCFIHYNDICDHEITTISTDNIHNRYYPIRTCLNNHNNSVSFKYECDTYSQTLSYYEYNGIDCNESDYNSFHSLVNINATNNASNVCMEYMECRTTPNPTLSPTNPTLSPTNTPSFPPTNVPTPSPTTVPTRFPTYDIPFWNKSLDQIVEILKNGTENGCPKHDVYGLFIILMFIHTVLV